MSPEYKSTKKKNVICDSKRNHKKKAASFKFDLKMIT